MQHPVAVVTAGKGATFQIADPFALQSWMVDDNQVLQVVEGTEFERQGPQSREAIGVVRRDLNQRVVQFF